MNFAEQLIRCSALGNIMTTSRGSEITAKQTEELNELLTKIKLTEKQAHRRDELVAKRDAQPELSATAKSYLKELFLESVFGRQHFMQNKYTEKGTLCEMEGIRLANDVLKWNLDDDSMALLEFSKVRVNNEWITGEMDVNLPSLLADIKCPWDLFTFPFFESELPNKDYYWQLQGYMMLTGHKSSELVYCLVDAPEHMIIDEQRRREWQRKDIELPQEIADQIRRDMTFGDISPEIRVKRWVIDRNDEDIEKIKQHVEMAREYLDCLYSAFNLQLIKINL